MRSFPLTASVATQLHVIDHADSTNTVLRQRHIEHPDALPHLSVVMTNDQRSGRGRLGRTWQTPPGAAWAISVLLDVRRVPLTQRGWIPLAAGLAMTEAIAAQLTDRAVAVKWPNDVLVEGRKICGILAEALDTSTVIVGAGVNTAMTADQRPVDTATSFHIEGGEANIDRLTADYVARLDTALTDLATHGTADASGLRRAVSDRCSTLGLHARALVPTGNDIVGEALRLDPDGCLVLHTPQGEIPISAADIVHLRPV